MKNIDEFLAVINLCNNTELETLTTRCEQLLNERKTAARNGLRQELMENLQKAIGDILHNGFDLTIANTERDYIDGHEDVWFCSDDHYHIEIEQRFAATLILC